MNQKSWEIKNTTIKTDNTCPNCYNKIINHMHYQDIRFCESCKNMITEDYNSKKNNPDDHEQIVYFGWYSAEDYLQSVYEELTNNSDSIYYE